MNGGDLGKPTRTRSDTPSAASQSPMTVPVDVVQKVLGHASLQTTIYVQAEKQRVVAEVARYYAGLAAHKTGQ